MDEQKKETLLATFRHYLDCLPENDDDEEAQSENHGPEIDLYSLFSELVALKSEIRIESRQVKKALEEFQNALHLTNGISDTTRAELERCRQEKTDLKETILRPVIYNLIDFYDRLAAGEKVFLNYQPSLLAGLAKKETGLIAAAREGHSMGIERFEQLLTTLGVEPINCLKQPFDPTRMKAVAIENRANTPSGSVLSEVRRGFIWNNNIIRAAEVTVNKK